MPNKKTTRCNRRSKNKTDYRPLSILAIDPGTRTTGLALFEGPELVYGKVKDFGFQKSTKKLLELAETLITNEIRRFQPHAIIVEQTFFYRNKNTSKLIVLAQEFKAIAKAHGIPVVEYAPKTARKVVMGDGNAVKRTVAETLCRRYPELSIHLQQTHLWKESYWHNMFDAVALGLCHLINEEITTPINRSG